MATYALLQHPGHNRVYFEASRDACLAELTLAATAMGLPEPTVETLGGLPYFQLQSPRPLTEAERRRLSRLSFAYALFERLPPADGGEGDLLRPIPMEPNFFVDPSIGTILKYGGKTNELFTKLMIGVARDAGAFADQERLTLLDPVAGKGTTLFEGLVLGYDVCGIEIGTAAAHEACVYLRKYLETEKYKHTVKEERLSGPGREFKARVTRFELAPTKEALKSGEARSATIVAGSAKYADKYLRKNSVHLIAGDLPYGVAHGSVTNEKQSSLTRNPSELVRDCLPAWKAVLKPGGAIALAWNSFVLPRAALADVLREQGLTVLEGGPFDRFEHRVDRSIKRDLIVAKK